MNHWIIKWAVFDYGGVLAEEGFVAGLHAMAEQASLSRDQVFETAREIILSSGYLVGKASEDDFWKEFKWQTRIKGNNIQLKNMILSGFVLRPWMLELVVRLRNQKVKTAILSDQVNWLDELNERDNFFGHFDHVFNSFHLGLSKNDPVIFEKLTKWIKARPEDIVFIDDHLPHVLRARSRGIHAIHYTDKESFFQEFSSFYQDHP
ncbi:HAD family hydrolase [Desulfonatronovibrio hydrogenovorans]|uniref:HAD family hydrolase n=1 Tax=Desulfonatronovibrio hydrogenovorans TaxID=53245 RepID=UPI00048C1FD4|nr:HAD family phosphatase [Desulfonatronovibrio hydrogenovorans]